MQLSFPISSDMWMTSNQRMHWGEKARRTARVRALGEQIGRSEINRQKLTRPVFNQCSVTAVISYPTKRRADPANTSPTLKALIDGLTNAGYWEDDDSTHVTAVTYTRGEETRIKGRYQVTLIITPIYKEQ